MNVYLYSLLALLGSFSSLSIAAVNIPLDSAVFARDREVGSTTNWKASTDSQVVWARCSYEVRSTGSVNGPLVPGFSDVYQTNNPGIGVRFRATSWDAASVQRTLPFDVSGIGASCSPNADVGKNMRATAQLVIVGPVSSGTITTFPAANVTYRDKKTRGVMDIKISTVPTIKASTCDVGGNIDVKMPDIGLNRLTEVGSNAGRTPFNIGMNCDPSISVHMVITDAQNPGNIGNVLTLSSDSEATGVGYQILRENSPINFGPSSSIAGALNQFKVVSSTGSTGGRYIIPFSIQYQRTASSRPGTGTANANAVFTMSYQ
ncbi:hypothetical protein C4K00_2151 [Pseudomonas synxantha]|uniref:fimbrial protein n=1 Tax=Pseudomonas synxantha TaxID=47883 RepID=UPI000F56E753|nr:fimbrial protein [Pseudomonas synxantha]AZE72380.1 hypothetical protein C4K00_2151 [Pseudomonas synxantha]AZE78049.1 hypothetical protein C4J99_2264 [Pseudomonas synxantha]